MKAIRYIRVSTQGQGEDGVSLDAQEAKADPGRKYQAVRRATGPGLHPSAWKEGVMKGTLYQLSGRRCQIKPLFLSHRTELAQTFKRETV